MSRAGSTSTRGTSGASDRTEGPTGLRRWVKRGFLLLGAAFGVALAAFAVAYARTDIPSPNDGFDSETTIIYYAGGKKVLGRLSEQNRTLVELGAVPQHVQDAVIAAEDKTFYSNQGIDPKGIIRAAFNNASGGDTQGASTITQQYVKVYYLSQERTYSRKIREAILSLKIHRQLEKDEILEGYLNRSASQLNVRQGAALAAIINSPNSYDPADGKSARSALKSRYSYVLDQMSDMATLPSTKKDPYKLPKFAKPRVENVNGGQRGHALAMVRAELSRLGYSDQEIEGGGLRVTTTFTRDAMKAAQTGVTSVRPDLKQLHAAAATVDVKTGALRGMYAGQDYLKSQLNWAAEGGAPGSAFKPFTLAAGLDYGYALDSTFYGNSPYEVGGATFENQGEGGGSDYGEAISLLTATQQSVNTAYVDLADTMDGGLERILDTAVAMGIPRKAPGLDENLSMVLGSATVSVIDMANAYATIAAEGQAKDWYVIQQIKGPQGGNEYKHKVKTEEAIPSDVAADTSFALQQVATSGTGTNANVIGRPIAGKTGTATNDDGDVRSSWFVGYTPQLSTAVMYVRGNGNQPLDGYMPSFYGGDYPAQTWAAIMSAAMEGMEILSFPPPAYIDQTAIGNSPTPTPTPEPEPEPVTPTSSPTEQETESGGGGGGGNSGNNGNNGNGNGGNNGNNGNGNGGNNGNGGGGGPSPSETTSSSPLGESG